MDSQAYITKGIKFVFNNEIRKVFNISDYNSMIHKIYEAYDISLINYKIWYRDEEEDLITISCEDDFEDALDYFNGKSMKILIEPKATGLGNASNLMSTINPNYDPRPNASLAESTAGLKEMNFLNTEIELSQSLNEEPEEKEESKVDSPIMVKDKSESSAFDFGVYDRDIDETNDLINEISLQLEDLEGTFDQMTHKQKQRELQRLKMESEAKGKLEQELRAKTEIQLEEERQKKARDEEVSRLILEKAKQAEIIRQQAIEAEKQKMEEKFNLQKQKMAKKHEERIIKKKFLDLLRKSISAKTPKKVKDLSDSDVDDDTPIANRNARKHEINVLKELEAGKYQKIVHEKIKWNICNAENILGIRYLCIECEDFNICSNCERVVIHDHPLLKFKTPEEFINFMQNLSDEHEAKQQKVAREEEKISELDISKPKIIDHVFDFENKTGASDALLEMSKAICTKVMPMSGHIISLDSDNIYLTATFKNWGNVAWPDPFQIICLNMHCDAYYSEKCNISKMPNQEIAIEVVIKNPGTIGHFNYIFSLSDNVGNPFGTEFSFDFEVKESIFSNVRRHILPHPQPSIFPHYTESQNGRTRDAFSSNYQPPKAANQPQNYDFNDNFSE